MLLHAFRHRTLRPRIHTEPKICDRSIWFTPYDPYSYRSQVRLTPCQLCLGSCWRRPESHSVSVRANQHSPSEETDMHMVANLADSDLCCPILAVRCLHRQRPYFMLLSVLDTSRLLRGNPISTKSSRRVGSLFRPLARRGMPCCSP